MTNYLLICALAPETTDVLLLSAQRVTDTGCNVDDVRTAHLGGETSLVMLASGTWDAIAKLESSLAKLQRDHEVSLLARRTEARRLQGETLPYAIEITAADAPGIVHALSDYFAQRGITVESLSAWRYTAVQTGTPMFSAQLTVGMPVSLHIAAQRDELMDFCDRLNLDAIIEPIRS